jgi:hypothetical protein
MTLATSEFIRRFLIHVPPKGFHRIRYYGLLAKSSCAENLARARQLLAVPKPQAKSDNSGGTDRANQLASRSMRRRPYAHHRGLRAGCQPHHRPSPTTVAIRIDTS